MNKLARVVWKVGMMDKFGYTIFHALFDFALLVAIIVTLLNIII